MTTRQEKVTSILRKVTALFFSRESDRSSMITVTKAEISKNSKKAIIYISVYPKVKEESALQFAKRKRTDLRKFISSNTKMRILPILDIEIDQGEKNRQHIEELIVKDKK